MGIFVSVNDAVYSVDDTNAGASADRSAGRPAKLVNPVSYTILLDDVDRDMIAKILAARPDLANANGKGGQAAAIRFALGVGAAALESAD